MRGVDLLHREGAEDSAQVACDGLVGDLLYFVAALVEELLGSCADGDVVALDLNLCHAIHLDGHAQLGVHLRRHDVQRDELERHGLYALG